MGATVQGEGTDLTVDPPAAFQWLTAQGYAWAASSYRRNSYDPGIGVIDTKNLTQHDAADVAPAGQLDETYLAGASMGGHVTAAAIETYANTWDGALQRMRGGRRRGAVRLLPRLQRRRRRLCRTGARPPLSRPQLDVDHRPADQGRGLSTNPAGQWAGGFAQILGAPSPLTPAGSRFKDFVEVGSGGDRVTYDVAWNYWHGLASPTGDFFFELASR